MIKLGRLYELGRWKNQIVKRLAKDPSIVDAVLPNADPDSGLEDQLLGNPKSHIDGVILPHQFMPGIQEETKAYICVEITMPEVRTRTTSNLYVVVWEFCHKSILDTYERAGAVGSRADIMAADIDRILNGSDFLEGGIGQLELKSVTLFDKFKNYYGYTLLYSVSGFNHGINQNGEM